ncbi:MAG: sugar ABC transporter permease [Clostridiales bacterium]|nr:sugar ABC transporter permease [Clostridiales bacterium]
MTDLEFLRLNGPQKFLYKLRRFLMGLPKAILNAFKGIIGWFVGLFKGVGNELYDIFDTFRKGDWKTRLSYLVMGFGSCARGQWLRGILFFGFQTVFNVYLFCFGGSYVAKLATLGTVETHKEGRKTIYGDNSFLIMLYGVLTIFFILAFLYTWRLNVKQNKLAQQYLASGKKLKTARQDVHDMLDSQFHKTLLALPVLGVTFFTVLPIIFMILVAFTNYDNTHQPPGKLFTWVGTENFKTLLTVKESPMMIDAKENADGTVFLTVTARNGDILTAKAADKEAANAAVALIADGSGEFALTDNGDKTGLMTVYGDAGDPVDLAITDLTFVQTPSMAGTFKQVLLWTLIWAFFATFLNYFLGMLVAIMINKKGIKFKKLWRTILVMTIAIPQFISLLYVSKMFAADGLVNSTLMNWGWIKEPLPFWTDPTWAKCTIIGINIWIGIPYLMLIATGILMNIPADLYESARIDGANAFQTYMKITLPYMLFVTGPYLLTSFTGNINNFNVIYLLSQGKPLSVGLAGNAGSTDLLITWLYKMTVTDSNYKLAAVLGILVFVVCAVINLIVYNMIPSVKNEEDFQ